LTAAALRWANQVVSHMSAARPTRTTPSRTSVVASPPNAPVSAMDVMERANSHAW